LHYLLKLVEGQWGYYKTNQHAETVIELLLQHHADPTIPDLRGRKAIDGFAAYPKLWKCFKKEEEDKQGDEA